MTCEHCGSDRTNSPFPDCDCLRRNQPVPMREGIVIAAFAGAAVGLILSMLHVLPW
jgi:hypothetical protein